MRTILKRALTVALLALAVVPPAARAGSDLDVFIPGLSVKPNVMIMFDNSGSMADPVPYDPAVTYTGSSTPTT